MLTREMEQLQLAKEQKTNKVEETSNKVRGTASHPPVGHVVMGLRHSASDEQGSAGLKFLLTCAPLLRAQVKELEQQLTRLTAARAAALDDARSTEAAAQQALEATQESFRVLQQVRRPENSQTGPSEGPLPVPSCLRLDTGCPHSLLEHSQSHTAAPVQAGVRPSACGDATTPLPPKDCASLRDEVAALAQEKDVLQLRVARERVDWQRQLQVGAHWDALTSKCWAHTAFQLV